MLNAFDIALLLNIGLVQIDMTDALLIVNGVLVAIVAYFLKLGVNVGREALAQMHQMQTEQALHSDAIARHERALERLLQ